MLLMSSAQMSSGRPIKSKWGSSGLEYLNTCKPRIHVPRFFNCYVVCTVYDNQSTTQDSDTNFLIQVREVALNSAQSELMPVCGERTSNSPTPQAQSMKQCRARIEVCLISGYWRLLNHIAPLLEAYLSKFDILNGILLYPLNAFQI